MTRTAVVLLTRDLRVHDNPALATACANADRVVPLFVLDPRLGDLSPNRSRFLHQSLADLRASLRERDGDLVLRAGDPIEETLKVAREVGATMLGLAADVSAYAREREARLRAECDQDRIALRLFPGVTVVDPGALRPSGGGDAYRVLTPYPGPGPARSGTGNDSRPHRRFNPVRQAHRFDPDGSYVRRYLPELAGIDGPAVHEPWRLPAGPRATVDYPTPLEPHRDEAVWLRP